MYKYSTVIKYFVVMSHFCEKKNQNNVYKLKMNFITISTYLFK